MNKDIYFLNAKRFSAQQKFKRFFSLENIKDISNKKNWIKIDYEKIKENNFSLFYNEFEESKKGIPLNNILEVIDLGEPIELVPNEKYRELTVLWYGRGIERRTFGGLDFLYGSQIKTKRWIAKKGWLILDKINARKGAFGLIPKSLDNSLTRKETYVFFKIKEDFSYLNPLFLVAYLTSDEYQDYFDELSHGTAHKLITTKKFLSIKVSLTEEELKQKNLEFKPCKGCPFHCIEIENAK